MGNKVTYMRDVDDLTGSGGTSHLEIGSRDGLVYIQVRNESPIPKQMLTGTFDPPAALDVITGLQKAIREVGDPVDPATRQQLEALQRAGILETGGCCVTDDGVFFASEKPATSFASKFNRRVARVDGLATGWFVLNPPS